jgi:cytochrome c-type biogenesis protein CcmH/NrfG
MTDDELKQQFQRCKAWQDPDQWIALGDMYLQRGYSLNALYCYREAENCKPTTVLLVQEVVCLNS